MVESSDDIDRETAGGRTACYTPLSFRATMAT